MASQADGPLGGADEMWCDMDPGRCCTHTVYAPTITEIYFYLLFLIIIPILAFGLFRVVSELCWRTGVRDCSTIG